MEGGAEEFVVKTIMDTRSTAEVQSHRRYQHGFGKDHFVFVMFRCGMLSARVRGVVY